MASVEIKNVFKYFDDTQVLEDISVKIEDGEFLVLVGPSGCGKSTLLRMVAGLEDITSGEILINATLVNKLPPKARDVAMVFQNYALYPHLTVAENMGFSLMLAGAPKLEKVKRVNDVATMLGLADLLDRKPKNLSGGQRQRVAMGRAIVRKPQLFLFDEPLSNLDAKLRVAMRSEIKSLHQKMKSTAIYVTHDQVEAMTMADRIVVMNEGRIEQIGRPLELYDNPVNVFVAGFIGTPSMNFLAARVDLTGSMPKATLPTGDELPLPELNGLRQSENIIYGMRPEHCSIADAGTAVVVDVIEPMGAETQLILKLGYASIVVTIRDRVSLHHGEKIKILPDVSKVVIFKVDTGTRV